MKKLYHIRFDTLVDAQAAAKQLDGVAGVDVVGVSEAHSHGKDVLVLRLDGGVTVEELLAEAPALEQSSDVVIFGLSEASELPEETPAPRVVPVMTPEGDGSENL